MVKWQNCSTSSASFEVVLPFTQPPTTDGFRCNLDKMEWLSREVLLMTLKLLPKSSLRHLCLTSKTFYDLSMPELYRDIIIEYWFAREMALLEDLAHSNHKSLWVRSLTFSSSYLQDYHNPQSMTEVVRKKK